MKALIVQHIAGEGPGLLREVLEQNDWEINISYMDEIGNTLPEGASLLAQGKTCLNQAFVYREHI